MARPKIRKQAEVIVQPGLKLRDNEDVGSFSASLDGALARHFEMPERSSWGLHALGDGWAVVWLKEEGAMSLYRTAVERNADGIFTFSPFGPVRQTVGFEPTGETEEDTTEGSAVATVAGKTKKVVKRPVADSLADRASDKNELFFDRLDVSKISRLSDADAQQYPKASPTGKAFLGIYRAGGTIVGQINHNSYLYQDVEIDANVARLKGCIEDAYAHKVEDGPNFALADLIGAADHPGMFQGESVKDSCTMLLDIVRTGDAVDIVFGIMDTTVGRDQQSLIDYGMPVATSMRSSGIKDLRVMGPSDPYFDRNPLADGQEYLRITDLKIIAFDLVVRPASDTYVQQRLDQLNETDRSRLTDAYQRLRDAAAPPKQEKIMDKEALKAALKDMSVEDFKQLAPELCAAVLADADPKTPVVDAAPADVETAATADEPTGDPVEAAPVVSEPAAVVAPVAEPPVSTPGVVVQGDALAAAKAENAALRAQLDAFAAEKKAAEDAKLENERRHAVEDALAKLCAGLDWREAREAYLREAVLDNPAKTAADLEDANAAFEKTFLPLVDRAVTVPAGAAKTAQEAPGEPAPVVVTDRYDPLGGLGFSL